MPRAMFIGPLMGAIALLFVMWRYRWLSALEVGTDQMAKISGDIARGASAFLKAEYRVLAAFVVIVAFTLAVTVGCGPDSHPFVAVSFVVGACCSALAGFIGMKTATKANVRTANAARNSLGMALEVAIAGGSVVGLVVVGLALIGLGLLFILYMHLFGSEQHGLVLNVLTGFSLGASSIAIFARVGGGIYTKAADVGADLVGKVEAGIPEDHPLNPATIADNVGDNVGDIAGMGADLCESYVGAIIGTMLLGSALMALPEFVGTSYSLGVLLLPLVLAGAGVVTSILGAFFVRCESFGSPQRSMKNAEFIASALLLVIMHFIIMRMLPQVWVQGGQAYTRMGVFGAVAVGTLAGFGIGSAADHYTGIDSAPVKHIARQSLTGSATNVIAGLGVGMMSTAMPILLIVSVILVSFHVAGMYGIAIAAVGMLANLGFQLAVDAYGPISDNAGGIAEMAHLPKEVRSRTDKLDAVGNTTAATGKGFAIGSAALTALVLFAAFMQQANLQVIDLSTPAVMTGLLLGAMLPFVFSSMAMTAVGGAAMTMIEEVRRQFRDIPQLHAALAIMRKCDSDLEKATPEERLLVSDAEGKAQVEQCVTIATKAALRKMIMPGMLALFSPILVGFIGGPEMLAGLLAGATATGVLMAIFQANSGGAWDNAKKMFEGGMEIEGRMYGKGSDPHKAAVVGDTVGDPFKDTSGPSLNILIKLMSVAALVIAPSIAQDRTAISGEHGNTLEKAGTEWHGPVGGLGSGL